MMVNWFQLTEQNFNWSEKKAFRCKREQVNTNERAHNKLNITQIVKKETRTPISIVFKSDYSHFQLVLSLKMSERELIEQAN